MDDEMDRTDEIREEPDERALWDFGQSLLTSRGGAWLFAQLNPEWMDERQKLVIQGLYEATEHMRDAERKLRALARKFPRGGGQPSELLHQKYRRATSEFFNAFYSAMERLMKFSDTFKVELGGNEPPRRSVERFLDWLDNREPVAPAEPAVEVLRSARHFRTALTHAAELPAHDWATIGIPGTRIVILRLFGYGPVPARGEENPYEQLPGDWHVMPPLQADVVQAFHLVLYSMFGLISGSQAQERGFFDEVDEGGAG